MLRVSRRLKVILLVGSILLILLTLLGCGQASPAKQGTEQAATSPTEAKTKIDFLAVEPTGVWYPLAVAIGKAIETVPEVGAVSILPGAAVSNISGINEGKAQIGHASAMGAADAWNGRPPFKEPQRNIREMAAFFPMAAQLVVLKDSDVRTFKDLKGKRVGLGSKGGTPETLARMLLEANGMRMEDISPQYLGFADSIEQLKDRKIDAILLNASVPYPLFTDLAQTRDIRLVGLTDKEIEYLHQQNSGLTPGVIPAGTYRGVDYDTKTVQQYTIVLVNKDVPDQLVYKMVKALHDNLDSLRQSAPPMKNWDPKLFAADIGVPFHPGAERYYREQGWLK